VIALAGFAVFPACFLSYGTRSPRAAMVALEKGPTQESGGQRLIVPPGEHPAERATQALLRLGWTPSVSQRNDEIIGTLHDNSAVVRWSSTGWWVRVEQRSDFITRQQVPTWDHPWEALRLLHMITPNAGPALGWQAMPSESMSRQLMGDAAENEVLRLSGLAKKEANFDAQNEYEKIFIYLHQTPMTLAIFSGRLRASLAHASAQKLGGYSASQEYISGLEMSSVATRLLKRAVEQHQDPYSLIPADIRLQEYWNSDEWDTSSPIRDYLLANPLMTTLAHRNAAPLVQQGAHTFLLGSAEISLMRQLRVPGWESLPVIVSKPAPVEIYRVRRYAFKQAKDVDVMLWWNAYGQAWVLSVAAGVGP
jgi:hypothetical protein